MVDALVGNTINIHITWKSISTFNHDFRIFAGIGTRGTGSPYSTLADEYSNFTMHAYSSTEVDSVPPNTSRTDTISITFDSSDIGTWDVVGLITDPTTTNWGSITISKIWDMDYATSTVTVSPIVGAQITSVTFDIS